jgi:glycosyltransferase involved in cell wall biosynthesis
LGKNPNNFDFAFQEKNMCLLVINYEMDDDSPVLAWQAEVVRMLSVHFQKVIVLTEKKGSIRLPQNVTVNLLPRNRRGLLRFNYWFSLFRLVISICLQHRPSACFIHMAHDWAYRLYPVLKLFRVPILLWYAHGTTSTRLRLAHYCSNRVVTSSPEGFRIRSKKVRVIGQGIDVQRFSGIQSSIDNSDILYVGRISKRKRIDLLIDAIRSFKVLEPDLPIRLKIIGPPLTHEDLIYEQEIRARVWKEGLQNHVEFIGYVPNIYIPKFYEKAFLHISVSRTGSMDKTILESLACGCPVLTSNEAFFGLLKFHPEMLVRDDNPDAIARQILHLYNHRGVVNHDELRQLVLGVNDLESYIHKLLDNLQELSTPKD